MFSKLYKSANDRIDTDAVYERLMQNLEKDAKKCHSFSAIYPIALAACFACAFFGIRLFEGTTPSTPDALPKNEFLSDFHKIPNTNSITDEGISDTPVDTPIDTHVDASVDTPANVSATPQASKANSVSTNKKTPEKVKESPEPAIRQNSESSAVSSSNIIYQDSSAPQDNSISVASSDMENSTYEASKDILCTSNGISSFAANDISDATPSNDISSDNKTHLPVLRKVISSHDTTTKGTLSGNATAKGVPHSTTANGIPSLDAEETKRKPDVPPTSKGVVLYDASSPRAISNGDLRSFAESLTIPYGFYLCSVDFSTQSMQFGDGTNTFSLSLQKTTSSPSSVPVVSSTDNIASGSISVGRITFSAKGAGIPQSVIETLLLSCKKNRSLLEI